jgi:NAD(P)-dependent dehydrogenase (short-subunit alcohol dehydrogenase family)
MDDLRGKVAVVTGAASGLGRAMAERFADEGMTVAIADLRLPAAQLVASAISSRGGHAFAAEVDVSSRESVESLAERMDAELGGANVLVNNAGVMSPTPLLRSEELGWRWIVEVNLLGVVYGLQAFVPRMLERGQPSHVVNVASLGGMIAGGGTDHNRIRVGERRPGPPRTIYGYFATKHAVVAISEALSSELDGTCTGLSVLCPSHHHGTGIFENSARFRPPKYGGQMTPEELRGTARSSQQGEGALAAVLDDNATGKDPAECAARVVRAIRENHFYIFTHPNSRAVIEERFARVRAGLDDADTFHETAPPLDAG